MATLPCSALQVLPPWESFLHEFRQLANDSAGSTIEPERWQNQSQADAYHGDMEDVRKAPPEADDRSHTGGRCDGGRQQVNSTLRPAAQRQVGKHTKLHFTLKTCAHSILAEKSNYARTEEGEVLTVGSLQELGPAGAPKSMAWVRQCVPSTQSACMPKSYFYNKMSSKKK